MPSSMTRKVLDYPEKEGKGSATIDHDQEECVRQIYYTGVRKTHEMTEHII